MATGQPDAPTPSKKKLTALQQRFCEAYARLWKGAPAARVAGYATGSAKQTALDLLKDERILAAIKEEAVRLGMSIDEATVRMSEWGRVTADDVLTKVEYEETTKIHQPLEEAIQAIKDDIDYEYEFMVRSWEVLGTSEEDQGKELLQHQAWVKHRKLDILRHKMQLERNPNAFRIIDGPKVKKYRMQVDLVKVHDLQAGHMIKKVKETKYGLEVELHDARDATDKILKLNGAYAPVKVDHTTNGNDMPGSNIMMPDNGRD
ncbi:terminase small subunit [Hymenobacter rigui]|uniref:Terminase small subunit n=1 Tax=Hymenobacter rigui TaxID=334424 RepID=A0A3R9P4P0_9BACT|nr:terminase small subunit [Hymenobacter rigui]RSK50086.1 hypothetical protein EI291_05395 [Hymenobacter rigui]